MYPIHGRKLLEAMAEKNSLKKRPSRGQSFLFAGENRDDGRNSIVSAKELTRSEISTTSAGRPDRTATT